MVQFRDILDVANRIAERFEPERIILFGSYAYGTPNRDSDVDLMVVMPCRGRTWDKEYEIRQVVRAPFAWDVLVRTPAELASRAAMDDYFVQEVLKRGKLLYEATHGRVDPKSGGRLSNRWPRASRESFQTSTAHAFTHSSALRSI